MLRTRKSVTRVVCCAFIVRAASGAGLLVASKHGAMMMGRVTDAVCVSQMFSLPAQVWFGR